MKPTVPSMPDPILFNPLKHHLGFLMQYIPSRPDISPEVIKQELLTIGHSKIDLYYGSMSLQEIYHNIIGQLAKLSIDNRHHYTNYIARNNNYKIINLPDNSRWVLRIGRDASRYIHIHPARDSKLVMRIGANSLKTILAAKRIFGKRLGLAEINQAREIVLSLDPLNKLTMSHGLGKYMWLLETDRTDQDLYEPTSI